MRDHTAVLARAQEDGSCATRERLLDAAEELFARKGYSGTSVREITTAAGSNLAAVNYHFGGKRNLYCETLLRRMATLRQQRLAALEHASQTADAHSGLEVTLRDFAATFLAPVREARPGQRPMRLLMRELVDPQLPGHRFETELVIPVRQALTGAIAAAAPGLDERTVQLCAQSFLAQLVNLLLSLPVTADSAHEHAKPFELAELAEHAVGFTIAAIDRLQEVRT